jgi:hypothetical protein
MNLLRQIGLMKPEGSSRRRGLVGIGAAAADYTGGARIKKVFVTGILSTPADWIIKRFAIILKSRFPFIPRYIAIPAASFRDARFVNACAVLAAGRKPVGTSNTRGKIRCTLPVFAVTHSQLNYIITGLSVGRGALVTAGSTVFAVSKRVYTGAIATRAARATAAIHLGNGIDAALSRRTRGNALPVHADVFSSTGPATNAADRILPANATGASISLFGRAASDSTASAGGHISTPGSAVASGHIRAARSALTTTAGRLSSASTAASCALALLLKDSILRTGLRSGLVVRAGAGSRLIRGARTGSGIAGRDSDTEVRTTGQALVAGSIGKAFAPLFSVGARGLLPAVAPTANRQTNACPSQNQISKGILRNHPMRFQRAVAHICPPITQTLSN